MAGEEGSISRQRALRRMMTLDGSGRGYGPPSLRYSDGEARRFRASGLAINHEGQDDSECDFLDFPDNGRGARASSDSFPCRGKSLFVESPMSSSELPQRTDMPTAGRFGWTFRTSKEKRSSRSGILAALSAAGWRASGSTPEPDASQTPMCTPPSSSEEMPSSSRQTGFVKLAPWARNRAKSFLTTPRLMRNSRRTTCWSNRNPKITPDMCTECDATCLPSSSTPSSSPPSVDGSSEEPEFLPLEPRRNLKAPDPPAKCQTPEASPPRISRLTIESVSQLHKRSASIDRLSVGVGNMPMVGARREPDEAERQDRTVSDITLESTFSSSRNFSDSSADSLAMTMHGAVTGREDDAGTGLPSLGVRSIAAGESRPPRYRRPRSSRHRVRFLQPSPKSYVVKESSGHARGHGGDDAVARLRELVSEDRGWPWAGRRILGVQYVSIGGQHRWIRSEGCQNAFLLVSGAMFLLELPVDALSGGDVVKEDEQDADNKPPPRWWYVKIDARTLKSISVPMGSEEVDLWANEGNSDTPSSLSQGHTDDGVIFHTRSGACLWVKCGNGISRDSLVRTVAMWHISETKTSVLDLRHIPRIEAEASMRSGPGGVMRSLLSERKSCLYRRSSPFP